MSYSPEERLPESIGSYRILRLLGQGGMGVVFEAEQDTPRRRVALKVVTASVSSDVVRRRFEREAQVLGHLQHPCIAQIYEAGIHAGPGGTQPYFAMELIRGVPLNEYANERGLGTRARLELIARILDGVQHAHQRGVIHRDLKPANILVDDQGQPKILDFGLARATDADIQAVTLHTDAGQILGTVPYMSPEQAAGDPAALDSRSDLYSLGVVAYELISGVRPYAADDPRMVESLRVVREEDARPLSSIDRAFRGDVETIIGKALEKEPGRRYASASDFAADIRRWLNDEPIAAVAPSAAYQLRKFARRNRALVIGLGSVFAALVAGLVGTARGYFAARAEAERARQTASFFQRILSGTDPAVAQGSDTTLLKAILDGTAERIGREFAGRPLIEASIRSTMASAYLSIADFEAALEEARVAHALFVRERGEQSPEALSEQRKFGTLLSKLGRNREAEEELSRCLRASEAALGPEHPETDTARCELGIFYLHVQRIEEAAAALEPVLAFRRRRLDPDNAELLVAVNCLGLVRLEQGRLEEAEELLLEALEGRRRAFGPTHPETIKAVHNLGGLYSTRQEFERAEAHYREAFEDCRRIQGEEHEITLAAQANLGDLLRSRHRLGEALEIHRSVYERFLALRGEREWRTLRAENALALTYRQMNRNAEAERHAQHALEGLMALHGAEDPTTLSTMTNLAVILGRAGDYERAEELSRQVIETYTRLRGEDHPDTLLATNDYGVRLVNQGRLEEAEPLVRRVLEASRRVRGDRHSETLLSLATLAKIHHRQQRFAEAVTLQGEFVASWSALYGDDSSVVEIAGELEGDLPHVEHLGPHEAAIRALLAFHERTLSTDNPRIARDLVHLGEALSELERHDEALEILERALARSGAPPPRAFSAYGASLAARARYEEAEQMLLLAWEDATALSARDREDLARRLIRLYEAWRRPEDAEAWRRQLAALTSK